MHSQFPAIYSHGITSIYIHTDVLDRWNFHRQLESDDKESFGVLIASKALNKEKYWIEQVTEPYPNDRSSRYSFQLQDAEHQKAVDAAHKETKGENGYFGTWHTHPESVPTPSTVDKRDWRKCIKKNSDRALFFAIVGIERTSIFFKSKSLFVALNEERKHDRLR